MTGKWVLTVALITASTLAGACNIFPTRERMYQSATKWLGHSIEEARQQFGYPTYSRQFNKRTVYSWETKWSLSHPFSGCSYDFGVDDSGKITDANWRGNCRWMPPPTSH